MLVVVFLVKNLDYEFFVLVSEYIQFELLDDVLLFVEECKELSFV